MRGVLDKRAHLVLVESDLAAVHARLAQHAVEVALERVQVAARLGDVDVLQRDVRCRRRLHVRQRARERQALRLVDKRTQRGDQQPEQRRLGREVPGLHVVQDARDVRRDGRRLQRAPYVLRQRRVRLVVVFAVAVRPALAQKREELGARRRGRERAVLR